MSTSVVHGSSTFYWAKLVGIVVEAARVIISQFYSVGLARWQRTTTMRAGKPQQIIDNILSFLC
jgi:hypothetical protein